MSEIAQIFTDFFRDLDVVPSDIIAGMFLLRRYQKVRMKFTVSQVIHHIVQNCFLKLSYKYCVVL